MEAGVVLVAAGEGTRLGSPKAFVAVGGVSLVERAAAPFARFRRKVAVLREDDVGRAALPGWTQVAGGPRRRDSVALGLAALGAEVEIVLVHDAARPFLSEDVLERVLAAAAAWPAVVPVLPVADTLKRMDGGTVAGTVDRTSLVAVQTPQAFRVPLLRRALAASDRDATDEAALVEALGERVRTVAGDPRCFKVTTPADLRLAEALAAGVR